MKKIIPTLVLILVIICLVIGLGYSLKVIIKKDKDIAALNQEITDLKNTVSTLNNTIEKVQDSDLEEKLDNKEEKDNNILYYFNEKSLVNKKEHTSITQDISDSMDVLDINVNSELNTLVLSLDKELARIIYGYTGEAENHAVTGFFQRIVDAKVCLVGNKSEDLKVILLMEDGTIKYIDINNILDKSYSVKTVAEDKDYINIIKVIIKDEEEAEVTYGIVGIKKDGTSKIIEF